MLMNKIGRKRTVQLSNVVTFLGLLLPFIKYDFATCLGAFALLGIGNTILQVSLNPLLTNVVSGKSLTSSLTAGQVIKAISSFCGPFIASFAAKCLGNWQMLFPIFAGFTLLSWLWLAATPIKEEIGCEMSTSPAKTFSLLKDKRILLLFLGIFFIVGVDVGLNTVSPKLLMERCGWSLENAGISSSVYFVCRTIGALLGSVLLARIDESKYFKINIWAATPVLILMFAAFNDILLLCLIGLLGFLCSSIFPIIYSNALKAKPERANDISGLMITGVAGGAAIPPLMGLMSDTLGSQAGSLCVILACLVYLIFCQRLSIR